MKCGMCDREYGDGHWHTAEGTFFEALGPAEIEKLREQVHFERDRANRRGEEIKRLLAEVADTDRDTLELAAYTDEALRRIDAALAACDALGAGTDPRTSPCGRRSWVRKSPRPSLWASWPAPRSTREDPSCTSGLIDSEDLDPIRKALKGEK